AFKSIIGVDTWKGVGYIMIILLAGLQSISRTYYEAAEIDGAGAWRAFRPPLGPTPLFIREPSSSARLFPPSPSG
ncbi:MAG: ABC transporter permease subunit, partial [Firmicutes bacterium]|nr:ABC transporter permease subunit [Bacillota bacterium]